MESKEAYALIRIGGAAPYMKMQAHARILKYGARDCGEIARQELMAEALSDLCEAMAILLARKQETP